MVGKRHDHLIRDMKGYAETLATSNAPNFGMVDFFVESTYKDAKGEARPCYLITRIGCDMVANQLTGEKGEFSASFSNVLLFISFYSQIVYKISAPSIDFVF